MSIFIFAFVTALFAFCAGAACAQSYPDKPIRFVVPLPPGGAADLMLIMDRNNLQIAALIQQWLAEQKDVYR